MFMEYFDQHSEEKRMKCNDKTYLLNKTACVAHKESYVLQEVKMAAVLSVHKTI